MTSAGGSAPKGWYYGWNIVAVCILSQIAANGLTYNTYSLWLHDWSTQLHAPISKLQLPIAFMGVFAALTSPFIGAIADKSPPRRMFTIGLLGMALFFLAASFVTSLWQLMALYGLLVPIVLGFCTAIPANALISRWFVRRRGLALGLSAFGIGMAGVVLPPIVAEVLPQVGWRAIWRAGAALTAFVVLPLVVFTIRNQPTAREGLHYVSGAGAAGGHHGHGHGGPSSLRWGDVWKRRNFWLLVAVYLPIMAMQGGVGQNLAPYAASHGFSTQAAGLMISVLSLTHVIATVALGILSDRFGNRLPFAGLAVAVAAGAALLAVGGGFMTLLAAGVAAEFGAEGFGRGFGSAMMFLPVSAFVPFGIASIQEATGSYTPALLGLAAIVLIGGALVLLMKERHGGHLTTDEKEAAVEDAVAPLP